MILTNENVKITGYSVASVSEFVTHQFCVSSSNLSNVLDA